MGRACGKAPTWQLLSDPAQRVWCNVCWCQHRGPHVLLYSVLTFHGAAVLADPYIWMTNSLGLASGLARLAVFAKYGFGPRKDDAH